MSAQEEGMSKIFEKLEFVAAILLGLAAIATAFASYQSSLYDGKSTENYSRSNKIATEAATERSRAVVEMSKDNTIDVEAMRLIMEADDAPTPTAEARNYEIATYLYTTQMSEFGYKALGLPPEARKAEEANSETPEAEEKHEALQENLLEKAMEKDLVSDENYRKDMLAKSEAQFDEAEKIFKEGQQANEAGDKFQLVAVIYAISLFFGGIVQVFHNDRMRWSILGVGAVLFVGASAYMLMLPWTS
jgi:hypothetical protein